MIIASTSPACDVCAQPLHRFLVEAGEAVHVGCLPDGAPTPLEATDATGATLQPCLACQGPGDRPGGGICRTCYDRLTPSGTS